MRDQGRGWGQDDARPGDTTCCNGVRKARVLAANWLAGVVPTAVEAAPVGKLCPVENGPACLCEARASTALISVPIACSASEAPVIIGPITRRLRLIVAPVGFVVRRPKR